MTVTLVEFLAPLGAATHQDRVPSVLYFKERYEGQTAMTVDQVRLGLKSAKVKAWAKLNVADVLNKSGSYTDTAGLEGKKRLWGLTDSGGKRVRQLLQLPPADPEVEHDVGTLQALVAKVSDAEVKDYLEEAVKCLRVGAHRACVVFTWSASVRAIQGELLAHGSSVVSAALQKHDPKSRPVTKLEDFAYVKDSVSLLAAKDLGILDKNQKDALDAALILRNNCGHPSKYKPGVKRVSSFLEDVLSIVFS